MRTIFIFLIGITSFALPVKAQDGAQLEQVFNNGFAYRNLGPFRVSAWVSDIAVPETPEKAHLYTFYVAARNGGVWKTTNNGTTFTPIFENKDVLSIGALAIAPSNSDIIWVGTGDASCTRSAYPGLAFTNRSMAVRTGNTWGCAILNTSLGSSFIPRIQTSSTSQ